MHTLKTCDILKGKNASVKYVYYVMQYTIRNLGRQVLTKNIKFLCNCHN